MKRHRYAYHLRRNGITVTELVVSAALLSATLLLGIQTLHLASKQQRVSRSQRLALQEASNAMERMMTLPYDELVPVATQQVKLAPSAGHLLPNATLQIEVTPLSDERAKKVAVTVMWGEQRGPVRAPQSLVAYRYAPPEAQE